MRERTPRNNTAMIVGAWKVIAASLLCCSALAEETETLKVVNWNVLYGFNHKKSVKQDANWMKKQAADVVAMQELNGHNQARLEEVAAKWGHDHAAILNKMGFPVGLTSSQPIEVIERRVKGVHHGRSLVVLDPGHGGRDPEAINELIGITEAEMTLDVCRRAEALLSNCCEVVLTMRLMPPAQGESRVC